MVAGDICYIKAGTYRETLSPANSGTSANPIVFKAFNNDEVVISATEPVSSWTVHSGKIYKTNVTMPMGVRRNMLYARGHAMDIARWPNNTDNDPFTINAEPVDNGTASTINRSTIPSGDWTGGYMWYLGAHSGTSWTRKINSSSAGSVTFEAVDITKWPFNPHNPTVFRNNNYGRFYLFGVLDALDYPGEWYYDTTNGVLYFNAPNNLNPNETATEYAARQTVINITKNYITIEGIRTFGGPVVVAGSNCKIKKCRITYGMQTLDDLANTSAQINDGALQILGSNNLIEGNLIEFSSANGISLGDAWNGHTLNTVHNNVIRSCNTLGIHSSPIRSSQTYATITNNTIYGAGRDGLYINGNNSVISYNDAYDCMKINNDGGIFYVVGNANDKNSVIHHNWFHDSKGPSYADGRVAGIYLDNHSKGYTVHHNVVSDITWAGIQINWDNWNLDFYNNSIYNAHDGAMGRWENGYTLQDVVVKNNYASKTSVAASYVINGWIGTDVSATTNIIASTSPFVSVSNKDFRPAQGSVLIDAGEVISGITDGFAGTGPDIGAYEFGVTPWKAGVDWEFPAIEKLTDIFVIKSLTIQYDMSVVATQITGAVSLSGQLTSGESVAMVNKGNNIYEAVLNVPKEAVQEFGVSYIAASGAVQEVIPNDCELGASSSLRLPTGTFSDKGTYKFKFNGCQISTYQNGAWDTTPRNQFVIDVLNDVTLSTDLVVSEMIIASEAKITVSNNSTLEIDGPSKRKENITNLLSLDFETMTTQELTSAVSNSGGVTAYELTSETAHGGTKSLKITSSGATNNFIFTTVNVGTADLGEYEFSFYAKATSGGSGLQRWRYLNWGGHQFQITTAFTTEWKKFSLIQNVTQTGTWVLQFQPATTGITYFDDIVVTKTGSSTASAAENILIKSGSSLITYTVNNNNVKATVERNKRFADGRYSFVGLPVANTNMTGSNLGQYVYAYNESVAYGSNEGQNRWVDASATVLSAGRGYAAAGGVQQISSAGLPNDGTVVVNNLTITSGTEAGWNLVSNPYPAALNVASVVAGLGSSVYLWDDGGSNTGRGSNANYMTVSLLGHAGGGPNGGAFNGYIGSAQGFFIKLTGNPTSNASVTFTEAMRISGRNSDANFFRQSDETSDPKLKVSLSSPDRELYSNILIGMRADATLGVDKVYDAALLHSDQQLSFYSYIENEKYTIQGLPNSEGVSTSLGFDVDKNESLIFKVEEIGGLPTGSSFMLVDLLTNETYDLKEINSFNFLGKEGKDQRRFELIYTSAPLNTKSKIIEPIYRTGEKTIKVEFPEHVKVIEYALYDVSGKLLIHKNVSGQSLSTFNVKFNNESLSILKIITNSGIFTRKFID